MNRYKKVLLTTVEEDFRAIGLLPKLQESDDPTQPRDIPSPDPSTLDGLDDSEGDKAAHLPGAKQPKPKMGPAPDDSDVMDPDEDGGSTSATRSRGGKEAVVKGSKEASIKGESEDCYTASNKKIMKAKGKNAGSKPVIAKGLPVVKKIGGMAENRKFAKVNTLIEEVQGLIKSVEIDEETDQLIHGFRLVAENAELLADRMIEIAHEYQVESFVQDMEDLSRDAAEAADIIENEVQFNTDDGEDEADAIRHSSDVHEGSNKKAKMKDEPDPEEPYDVPSPAFKEQSDMLLHAMVSKFMETLEVYNGTLSEMGMDPQHLDMEDADEPAGDEDGKEVHLHTKASKIHVHHGEEDDDDDDEPAGDEDEEPMQHHMADHDDEEGDQDGHDGEEDGMEDDDDSDHESDHDSNSLMARMKALRTRREAMGGGHNFPGGDE